MEVANVITIEKNVEMPSVKGVTNRKYDFFRYGGKSSATVTSFNKR